MATRLRINNVKGAYNAMLVGDASITLTAALPATAVPVSGTSYLPVVLDADSATEEIVWITGPASSGTTYPVSRGQEGSTARAHSAGSYVHGPTAQDLTSTLRHRGVWASASNYAANDTVTDAYALYVALTDVPSGSTMEPSLAPAMPSSGMSNAVNSQSNGDSLAQGFTVGATPITISQISLKFYVGSTGHFTIGIASAIGASPSAATFLTSTAGTGPAAAGTASYTVPTITLAANTKYYLVLVTTDGTFTGTLGGRAVGCLNAAPTLTGGVASADGNFSYVNGNGPATAWSNLNGYTLSFTVSGGPYWQKLANVRESSVVSKTAAYTMVDPDTVVLANGSFTVTLPAANTSNMGKRYTIKNIGTGTITIAPASGTIDGAANTSVTVQYSSLDLVNDGTNWFTV